MAIVISYASTDGSLLALPLLFLRRGWQSRLHLRRYLCRKFGGNFPHKLSFPCHRIDADTASPR